VLEAPVADEQRDEVYKLWEAGRLSGSDVSGDAELRKTYRDLASKSLYFFVKGILQYPDLTRESHLPYCQFLQDFKVKRTLDLMPRGVYKTTCGTIGLAPFYVLNHPNNRGLIANQTADNAEDILLEIEGHFDGSNSMVNWILPDMVKPGDKWGPWNRKQMRFPCKDGARASLEALGVGTRSETRHFHIIFNDDLIGSKDMESDREMLSAITWHDYSVSLFVNPRFGIERMHGTRWSLSDLYSVILEDPVYKYYIKPAIDPATGEALFPHILDLETLRHIRDTNYAVFMSQYMNDPLNPEALDFREAWVRRYALVKTDDGPACRADGRLYFVKDMDVVIVVDPAGSGDVDTRLSEVIKRGRAHKSNNAVAAVGHHGSGNYFLLDLWVGRGRGENPELQVAEQMMQMAMRWHGYARRGYVEAYGAQASLITIYNMLCRQQSFMFRFEEIPRGIQKAKTVRIRGALGSIGQNGQIYVRPSHDVFIYEYSRFPQIQQMDTLDAFTWAVLMLKPRRDDATAITIRKDAEKRKRRRLRVVGRRGY